MRIRKYCFIVGVVCLAEFGVTSAQSQSAATTALKNPDSITPEFVRNPANSNLVAALKIRAKEPWQVSARAVLLNAEDPTITEQCFQDLHQPGSYDQGYAVAALSQSGQASLIMRLAEDVRRSESVESKRVSAGDEVVRIIPASVLATHAIRGIILKSPKFNQGVKTWAAQLPMESTAVKDREISRESVRKWLDQNDASLRSAKYTDVRPPK